MSISVLIEELLNDVSDDFTPPLKEEIKLNEYAEKITRHATIFSIIEGGKLAGFIAVYCNDPEKQVAYVTMLAVSKSHRINGIGTQLIEMTVDYLKKIGFGKITLEIYKTNLRAVNFYRGLGFLIEKETDKSFIAYKNLF